MNHLKTLNHHKTALYCGRVNKILHKSQITDYYTFLETQVNVTAVLAASSRILV